MGDDQLKDTLMHLVSVIVTLSQGMVLASPIEVLGILKQGAAVPSANNFFVGCDGRQHKRFSVASASLVFL